MNKKQLCKRTNFTLKPEIDELLRQLAAKTGLKMATIVEKGILLFEKENK